MNLSRRQLTSVLVVTILITTLIVSPIVYVLAQSGTTLTISSGIYPGAPSYTIYQVSGTYYAKDQNGYNEFSNANIRTVAQSALDSGEVTLYFKNGLYIFTDGTTHTGPGGSVRVGLGMGDNDSIYGESRNGVVFTQADGTNLSVFITASGYAPSGGTHNDNVVLQSFTISGNYDGQVYSTDTAVDPLAGAGIRGYGENWHYENLHIYDVGEYGGIDHLGANSQANNILIENVTQRSVARQQYAMGIITTFTGTEGGVWSNIQIKNVDGIGFYFEDQASYNLLTNFYIYNAGWDGIDIVNNKKNVISNGIITTSGRNGVFFWRATAGAGYETDENKVNNVLIEKSQRNGIYLAGSAYNTITGNTLRDNALGQVSSERNNIKLEGNALENSAYNTIVGNTFEATANVQYHVFEDNSSQNFNTVTGNTFENGVAVNPASWKGTNSDFYGNVFYNVESQGVATISSSTSVTIYHNLHETPSVVLVTLGTTGAGNNTYVSSIGADTFTVNVQNSGTYTVYWSAKYHP